MAQAPRDQNFVPTLIAASNADGTTPVTLYADPTTHRLLTSASGGTAAGSDTQVQFNDGGSSLGGDAGFTYNKTTDAVTLAGPLNKVTITPPATSATLTLATGSSLVTSGANSITLTSTGATNVTLPTTGTLATLAGSETLTNKTLTSPILTTPELGTPSSGTLTSCTGLPIAGLTPSTSTAIGVGSIELGHATDTSITRVSAGVVAIEGVNIVDVSSAQTLTTKTLTAPIIGGAASLADAATVSLISPTADGTATGFVTSAFVSGYTSSAIGDLVYLDSSGKWQKTDANATATFNGLLGIALAVAATDATLKVALPGSIVYATAFPTFTIGAPVYMSETAGAVTATAPTTTDAATRMIGWGVHADKLYFFPSPDYITHT